MPRREQKGGPSERLFADDQQSLFEKSYEEQLREAREHPVDCLGMTFANDEERRKHFLDILREKLKDQEFRRIEGFPIGSDEDILALSDPPYYTACPNPFISDFIKLHSKPFDPSAPYSREPFAVDVSEGKTDSIYNAHSYHTKVPHLAIAPSILHYTEPGDTVLDGFCGSGMTGVAAIWCSTAPPHYRQKIAADFERQGLAKPKWGVRYVILNDLSPAATFIAANYNLPFDVHEFERVGNRIVREVDQEIGWMYETLHTDRQTKGRIGFMVWSQMFTCPECTKEMSFTEEALDENTNKVSEVFECPHCRAQLTKRKLEPILESTYDPFLGRTIRSIKRKPVLIKYSIGRSSFEKSPDEYDIEILSRIAALPIPRDVPIREFPFDEMWDAPRIRSKGITHVHHLFLPRTLHALAALWRRIGAEDTHLHPHIRALLHHQVVNASIRNTYRPASTFGNRALTSAYYVSAMAAEANVISLVSGTLKRIVRAGGVMNPSRRTDGPTIISTQSSTNLEQVYDSSIDYIFTDPPFGDNFPYAELNFVAEAWHEVITEPTREAIVDRGKVNKSAQKGLADYQGLMRMCFVQYYRCLKPGRWMTLVFSNSRNAVWHAIQEALSVAGFVVADVRTLDKQQGSFKQITSIAPKQDLVISAYKPSSGLENRFKLEAGTEDGVWDFVRMHLRQLPVFVSKDDQAEIVAERQNYLLFDRMVAFHVQRGVTVPLSATEFYAGLEQRFPARDGMYFLSDQVAEYDKKRMTVREVLQLQLFVTDESSAIQWLKQQLLRKPQTFQEIHPQFLREIGGWQKHERPLELSDMLEQNFLRYDGRGEVPSQIHSYLSTNFRELRNLPNDDESLRARGKDRWYVPDPNKAGDLEKLRDKALLKEFEEYRTSSQKRLRLFRLEAVRAGFKRAWQEREYATIIAVARKIPEEVLQEDPKLLMWYDQAVTRSGEE